MAKTDFDIGFARPHFTAALDDDPLVLVVTGGSLFYSLHIHNNTAAVAFVQVFNAAAISAVTLGATTPTLSFGVPASAVANYEFPKPVGFSSGIVIASTTEAANATGASTNVVIAYA